MEEQNDIILLILSHTRLLASSPQRMRGLPGSYIYSSTDCLNYKNSSEYVP